MRMFQQSESVAARRDLFVQMVDENDLFTPRTGLSVSVQMVKAGSSAYASIAGSVSEVGAGTYRVALAAADLDTEGQAMLKLTAPGAASQYIPLQVTRMPGEVHLTKAALVNSRRHTVETGVDAILDDDGVTMLRTLTPGETDGVITVSAQ